MDVNGWVIRDDVVAQANGRVLVIDGTAWFEWPLPRTLELRIPPVAPGKGPYAVRAHSVDVDRLDRRKQYDDGTIEGWAALTGLWRDHELHVHTQNPMPQPVAWTNQWATPPCPPPQDGWPTVPVYPPMTAANLTERPPQPDECAELTITQVTSFRPHPTQPVLVVAAEDPERAERALRPRFGAALCVVASEYRQQEIDATVRRLREEMSARRWPITSTGRSASSAGQPTVTAHLAWLKPEVAQWAETVPDGLLDLDVWLTPA
ncbi:MAG TPA: hypothetical protein VGN81_13610 [Pseudonocardiaceae bacterium]